MAMVTVTTDQRVRALFADWCAATGANPALPPASETLDAFFTAIPAAPATRRRREHALGVHTPPRAPSPVAIRTGEGWVDPGRALAQARTWGYPAGLRGRRDAWLVLLTLILRIPPRQALTATPADITTRADGELEVCGSPAPVEEDPRSCPACAATRWLRIAAPAGYGWRTDVRNLLIPVDPSVHDHARPLPDGWRDAWCLAPSVDRWGWVRTQPLTPIGLVATLDQRQRLRDIPQPPTPTPTPETGPGPAPAPAPFTEPHPPDPGVIRALADAYDDVDDRIDRLTDRITRILDDADDLDQHLHDLLR